MKDNKKEEKWFDSFCLKGKITDQHAQDIKRIVKKLLQDKERKTVLKLLEVVGKTGLFPLGDISTVKSWREAIKKLK